MIKNKMDPLEDFLDHATDRFDFGHCLGTVRQQVHQLYLDHQSDFTTLETVAGLQVFLQTLLEDVMLFDRKFYLLENLLFHK